MSRRRPSLPDGQSQHCAVKFVCTDRGQHARVVLSHLMDPRTGAESLLDEHGGLSIRCSRCRRNVTVRQENLFKLIDGLAALDADAAHPAVDISLLPF